jgi:hypothetical protein
LMKKLKYPNRLTLALDWDRMNRETKE